MNRADYFKHLTRQVRWRLPAAEAEGVLADYAELLGLRPAEGDGRLVEDLGTPGRAARLLTDRRAYGRWLAVFGWLALCLAAPALLIFRPELCQGWPLLPGVWLVLGMALSLVQFRPGAGGRGRPMSRGLGLALVGLAALVAVWAVAMGLLFSSAWPGLPPERYGPIARLALCLTGGVGAAAGLAGLVMARVSDRRWSALYLLGLTAAAVCAMVMVFLVRLDATAENWWYPWVLWWGGALAAGLVGTGVALC